MCVIHEELSYISFKKLQQKKKRKENQLIESTEYEGQKCKTIENGCRKTLYIFLTKKASNYIQLNFINIIIENKYIYFNDYRVFSSLDTLLPAHK